MVLNQAALPRWLLFSLDLTSRVTVQSVQVINFYFHRDHKRNWAGRTARENEVRHSEPIQGQ